MLFSSAIVALILANSPLADEFESFWKINFSIGFGEAIIDKDLHHWINDGLMAVFFFVVGLELKREIVAGELRKPRNAILPVAAAIGGMFFPAALYLIFNTGEAQAGWGIPMATDIAFALGILYLFGDRIPLSMKVFLTAIAIVDDLGAVLVIAFFYTSDINMTSLIFGGIFLAVLIFSNLIGVRNPLFYAIFGIGGLWVAFLLSGVHATIAAVLAAFTIPATVKASPNYFERKTKVLLDRFIRSKVSRTKIVSVEQFNILRDIRKISRDALTPLQRLESSLHPVVAFVIMPIFALSNAGVDLKADIMSQLISPVTLGVVGGLIIGKMIGVVGVTMLFTKFGWAPLPQGMNRIHLIGIGVLTSIGFTMSLFIAGLAFKTDELMDQAKLGILIASTLASVAGYFIIKKAIVSPPDDKVKLSENRE